MANDVETEQIVSKSIMTSLSTSVMTSYVQHRGSIPLHWSQDISANVVPAKPPICCMFILKFVYIEERVLS